MLRRVLQSSWAKAVLYGTCGVCTVLTVEDTLVTAFPVSGGSMRPCINPDTNHWVDFIVAGRWNLKNVNRGDIVVVWSPRRSERSLIKRVVGLPGDVIHPRRKRRPLPYVVPEGHIWIEGDNVDASYDSNDFGAISLNLVKAKALAVVFPRFQILKPKVDCTRYVDAAAPSPPMDLETHSKGFCNPSQRKW